MLPGFALATRRQHTVVGPNQETDNVGTLKIVPYAVAPSRPGARPGTGRGPAGHCRGAPFPAGTAGGHALRRRAIGPGQDPRRVPAADPDPPGALGSRGGRHRDGRPGRCGHRQMRPRGWQPASDLLIIAGQTSVIHDDDTTLRALRRAGAETTLSGAPVEPGNLLALAYFPDTPVLCAPGCAKGLKRNVVDLVLPRLLLGDRLDRRDIAALGLGGFLTAAERSGTSPDAWAVIRDLFVKHHVSLSRRRLHEDHRSSVG